MRIRFIMSFLRIAFHFAWSAWLLAGQSSQALEKKAVRIDEEQLDSWNAGATCLIRYFNVCSGWMWCWSGFEEDDRLGLVVDGCCGGNHAQSLLETAVFCCSGSWPNYGYTGTISVHEVDDNDCPIGPPLASQAFLPVQGNMVQHWNNLSVGNRFAVVVTTSNNYGDYPNSALFGTDHPAAGPSGPIACGACFMPDRPTRSFSFGSESSPICPGAPFFDGVCDAELIWHVLLMCPVAVEHSSWSSIKALYR